MKLLIASLFSFPIFASTEYQHHYESLIDFNTIGIGQDIYRLEIDIVLHEKPTSTTNKFVWHYKEPYGESGYRCETEIIIDAGFSHVRLVDIKSNKVLQEYSDNLPAAASAEYEVKSKHSRCRLYWWNKFVATTVSAPEIKPFQYAGQEFTPYFYGIDTIVRAHRTGNTYAVDYHDADSTKTPGPLLVRYGIPIKWVGEFAVSERP